MLLTSLTCITGSYWFGSMVLNLINKHSIQQNIIYTLTGKKFLVKPQFIQNGIMYKINSNSSPIAFGYSFIMKDGPVFDIKNVKNIIMISNNNLYIDNNNYLKFCEDNGILGWIQYSYDEYGGMYYKNIKNENIKIEHTDILNYGDVWYLSNKNNWMELIANMKEEEFKKYIIKKYHMPYIKISFALFVVLIMIWNDYWNPKKIDI